MNDAANPRTIYLCAAYPKPRIEMLSTGSREPIPVLEIPEEDRINAIDGYTEHSLLAAGTINGWIYLRSPINLDHEESGLFLIHKLVQGAPVLAICFAQGPLLAVSDFARRCLLWHQFERGAVPKMVKTMDNIICALCALSKTCLVGLSTEGKLLFWNLPDGELIREETASKPASISVMVRLIYWPEANALAYPGCSGNLVLYHINENRESILPAHDSEFYAIGIDAPYLFTVGEKSGVIKFWHPGEDKPSHEIQGPPGIVSADIIRNPDCQIYLVNRQGETSVFKLENGELNHKLTLPKNDYCMVYHPGYKEQIYKTSETNRDKANQIISDLKQQIEQGLNPVDEVRFKQLTEMGFERISISLRACHANKKGDVLEELRYRFQLVQRLSVEDADAASSILKFAELLETVWQIEKAWSMLTQLQSHQPDSVNLEKIKQWKICIDDKQSGDCVIIADIPIPILIESAEILGKYATDRYQVNALEQETWQIPDLTPESLISKYEQIKNETQTDRPILGVPQFKNLTWHSRDQIRQIKTIHLRMRTTNPIASFNLCFNFGVIQLRR